LLIDCAWGVARKVHGVAVARIVVATCKVVAIGIFAAFECCDDSGDIDGEKDALVVARVLDEAVPSHAHRPVACSCGLLELSGKPVSSGAYAAVRVSLA
jgi:hypothetical protein